MEYRVQYLCRRGVWDSLGPIEDYLKTVEHYHYCIQIPAFNSTPIRLIHVKSGTVILQNNVITKIKDTQKID